MREKTLSGLNNANETGRPSSQILNTPITNANKRFPASAWKEIYSAQNNHEIVEPSINIETLLSKLDGHRGSLPKVVGIDLRASEARKTGMALLEAKSVQTSLVEKDSEIIDLMLKWKPALISIDSPLSLPKGRDCTSDECDCRSFGISRECERTLRSRNVNVFWCLIQSMQGLTERGMRLARQLRELGFDVIESYPGAAQDILGITRKKISIEELKQGLIDFGLVGSFEQNKITHDELDAITSALVGYFYLSNSYEALGNEDEGYLIVPESDKI
jgi:predicted nuclease with RNAse H fold